MSEHDEGCCNPERRGLVGAMATAVIAAGTSAVAYAQAEPKAPARPRALTRSQRDALTPDQVIALMMAGNARFRSGRDIRRDDAADIRATAEGQYPAAIAITCIDSRAPVEVICDLGIGDVFVARVAGNGVNDDILGSAEYACAVAGARLVVVMGHTGCGAMKGAIDNVVLGNLTLLLARYRAAIAATRYAGERTSGNHAFVDLVARTNVQQTVAMVRARSPALADLEAKGAIRIIGAMYHVETGALELV